MWHRMYQALVDAGISVFSPGQRKGRCDAPYVVLADGAQETRAGGAAAEAELLVTLYVPLSAYSELNGFLGQVLSALSEFRLTSRQSAVTIDTKVQAYARVLAYRVLKKNKGDGCK